MKERSQDMLQKRRKFISNFVDQLLHPIKLQATHNDRMMYEILIKEFPELKDKVLIHDVDGIGLAFPPEAGRMRWRSLNDVYEHHLPEINRRADHRAYEQEMNDYVDGNFNVSNESSTEPKECN